MPSPRTTFGAIANSRGTDAAPPRTKSGFPCRTTRNRFTVTVIRTVHRHVSVWSDLLFDHSVASPKVFVKGNSFCCFFFVDQCSAGATLGRTRRYLRHHAHITMAIQSNCAHSFQVIKSDSTLVVWHCNICHSGPFYLIFECRYCKLHTCRPCTQSA